MGYSTLSQSRFYTKFTVVSICFLLTVFMLSQGGQFAEESTQINPGLVDQYHSALGEDQISQFNNEVGAQWKGLTPVDMGGIPESAANNGTGEDVFTDPDKLA